MFTIGGFTEYERTFMKELEPNYTWRLIGYWINLLADLGATDDEMRDFVKLEGSATLDDIAKLEAAINARKPPKDIDFNLGK